MPQTDHNAKTGEFYFGTFGEISFGIDTCFGRFSSRRCRRALGDTASARSSDT